MVMCIYVYQYLNKGAAKTKQLGKQVETYTLGEGCHSASQLYADISQHMQDFLDVRELGKTDQSFMYVCVHVLFVYLLFLYLYIHLFIDFFAYTCMYVFMYTFMYAFMYLCILCKCVCVCVCMYVCIYERVYAYMHICMSVCRHAWMDG